MKASRLIPVLLAGSFIAPLCRGATISQNFEDGEDTSNWASTWTGGALEPAFLDLSAGGENAGGGASDAQSFSRQFRNNTAGLDVTTAYRITMDVQLDTFDGPSGGQFEIIDGAFGNGNAANLRVTTTSTPGVFAWQARDNSTGWQDLGITLDLASPYRVELTIDPSTFTYDAAVHAIDPSGSILSTATLADLAFDQNVITNGQNGNLLFYIQASAGGTNALVDNINITTVPEPEPAISLLAAALVIALHRRRTPF